MPFLRDRAEQVINAIDDGVYFLDPEGITVFVNEAGARILGYTARELMGKSQHELIHHHYANGAPFPKDECPIYSSATEGVQQRVGGDVFWRKDGTPLVVDYTAIPIRENRRIVGVVVTFRDIGAQQMAAQQAARLASEREARTEAEEARTSLERSEARYRALIEAAGQFIWTNSAEGRMEGEQPGWTALTGQSTAEYQGFGWANAVHPDDADATVVEWNRAVTERRTFEFEHRVRHQDGTFRLFSIRAVPILNADGSIREWVGAHTDITDQRRAFLDAQRGWIELGTMFEQAPAAIALIDAATLTFRTANERYRAMLGGRELLGRAVLEALPELADQPFFVDMLREVIRSGVPYAGNGVPAIIEDEAGGRRERYFDFVYQPISRPDGTISAIMVHAVEIIDERARPAGVG